MRKRAPVLGWLLALSIVGGFSWYASLGTSWTSVTCARTVQAAGMCRIETSSLSRQQVYVVPLSNVGGTWLTPSSRGVLSGQQVWLGTIDAPIALSSVAIPRHQAEYLQHRLREFLLTPEARTLAFEEDVPWALWGRCVLVFLLMLLLPVVWKLAVAIEDVRRLPVRTSLPV